MNVLFINDSTSNANWGDRAAAISLKYLVNKSGGKNIEVIFEEELGQSTFQNKSALSNENHNGLHSTTKETLKLFIPPILLKIRDKFIRHSNPLASYDIIPQKWEDFYIKLIHIISNKHLYSDLLNTIDKSDLIVIHGDGCMTGCGRIPRAELFLTYVAKKHFGKPVIIVNHTADFNDPILFRMAQEVYPMFDDVVYRESISLERNRKLCNGRFAPDSAYIFKPASLTDWLPVAKRLTYFDIWPDIANINISEPYICIGGSGIYWYNKNYDAFHGFCVLIKHIKSLYSGQIILTASDLRDQDIFRPIAKQLNLPLISLRTPVQQSVDIIGNAEAYIGGRWHPSIFSLRGGTPIISISSNTFMMQEFAKTSGLSSKTFDALNLEEEKEAIGHQLNTLLEQGKELRFKLLTLAEKESDKIWDNVSYLKNKFFSN